MGLVGSLSSPLEGETQRRVKSVFNFLFCLSSTYLFICLSINHISALKVRFKFLQCAYSSFILQLYCKGNEGVGGEEKDKDREEKEKKILI